MSDQRNKLTLEKAKQIIEDYLIFCSLSIGRHLWIDFSKHSSKIIIEFAESLPTEFIQYSKTLDVVIEKMEKDIEKYKKANTNP